MFWHHLHSVGWYLGASADLWMVLQAARPALVVLGVVAVGLMAALVRRWRRHWSASPRC